MDNFEINNHIDFNGIFKVLFDEHKDSLEEERYQATHFNSILNFVDDGINEFEILAEECELNDKEIIFVYVHDFNDANESDTQGTSASYDIVYDRVLSEFTSCEFEYYM